MSEPTPEPVSRRAIAVIVGIGVLAIALVALSLVRPDVPEYAPTPETGVDSASDGSRTLTVDATDSERWRYVTLATGAVSDAAQPGWDLTVRRFEIRVNGGRGFAGQGGVQSLGLVALDSVVALPADGYAGMEINGRDTAQALLDDWYAYSFTSHLLTARDQTLAVRTADGRPAALRVLSYYCPGAEPGCLTIRYRFR